MPRLLCRIAVYLVLAAIITSSASAELVTIEDLMTSAAAHSPILIVNEAHDGSAVCTRTRRVGKELLPVLDGLGFKVLAMEALNDGYALFANCHRTLPTNDDPRNYTAAPDLRAMMQTALDLGWNLAAYDISVKEAGWMIDRTPQQYQSFEYTQLREIVEGLNLTRTFRQHGSSPMLIWCGNGHGSHQAVTLGAGFFHPTDPPRRLKMMGQWVEEFSGVTPYVIDQTVTASWPGRGMSSRGRALLEKYRSELEKIGGEGALYSDETKDARVDAYVLSTDNEFRKSDKKTGVR